MKGTLYVSNTCGHCHRARTLLREHSGLDIDVKLATEAPMHVDAVPMIVFEGTNKKLVGGEVFEYISSNGQKKMGGSSSSSLLVAGVVGVAVVYIVYTNRSYLKSLYGR